MWELNRAERKALVLAAALLTLGAVVREARAPGAAAWSWHPAADAGSERLATLREAVAEGAAREEEASRPLGRDERLDPNAAAETQLRRLSGIGPARARAIVEARERQRFRSIEDLLRVPGIGEATLARIAPHLELRTGPRAAPLDPDRSAERPGRGRVETPASCPGTDLNRANAERLERLPWVGPVRARAILEARRRRGGFRSVEELAEVSGIGPYTLDRLRPHVCVGRRRSS